MKSCRIQPCASLKGEVLVPGDKSISHRAVMLSALAEGRSELTGLLMGEDVLATIACFRAMGVPIRIDADRVVIEGVGLRGLKAPSQVLDCGNSGTTLRLMMGILAGQAFESRLTGDASLNRRPVERVAKPLREMGAHIEEFRASETERVVKVAGRPLRGIHYKLPVASAQVKSAILLAGLFAHGFTQIEEPMASRDHSEIMLQAKGAKLKKQGSILSLEAVERLNPENLGIPGDISSAAFFLVAGTLASSSHCLLKNVGVNPTRTGILDVLKKMGARIKRENARTAGGEEVADLRVEAAALRAGQVSGDLIPRLIDEIPVLGVAAAAAEGTTVIRDAEELRVKESDRIAAMARELRQLGVNVETHPDGLSITGPTAFQSGVFQSGGDHRIAMSMAVAATRTGGDSLIQDVDCVATSYPDFFSHLESLGVPVELFDS